MPSVRNVLEPHIYNFQTMSVYSIFLPSDSPFFLLLQHTLQWRPLQNQPQLDFTDHSNANRPFAFEFVRIRCDIKRRIIVWVFSIVRIKSVIRNRPTIQPGTNEWSWKWCDQCIRLRLVVFIRHAHFISWSSLIKYCTGSISHNVFGVNSRFVRTQEL